jgi:hypothetical protein
MIGRGQLNYSDRNLLYCHTVHTVSHGLNTGFLDGKPVTNAAAFALHRGVFFVFSRSQCLLHQVNIHQNVVDPKLQLFPTIMTSAGDCQFYNFFLILHLKQYNWNNYSKFWICKHMSDISPMKNGLKGGDS